MKKMPLLPVLALTATLACADDSGFKGDVGGMVVHTSALVSGADAKTSVLPYVYGDWGRFYGRMDTFGMRLAPMGNGHLELATRISTEGFVARKTAYPALGDRRAPLPIGLGTFQSTPLGGVFAYLMHDPQSGGQFAELTWASKFSLGTASIYPQLGLQYRSADYVNHLYGVTASESDATGLSPYRAGRSLLPQATLHMTLPLSGPWSLQAQARYRWLDQAIHDSPLVNTRSQTSGLLGLTYTLN
ncbi:MAG: MipA/OmpV family protein [Limnohabitans sp.]